MRNLNLPNLKRGFTLVELLIVIIIIAILAAIAIPKFTSSTTKSKDAALKSDLTLYRNAIELYHADTGYYPKLLADIAATAVPAQGYDSAAALQAITPADWHGPYVEAVSPNDEYGTAWNYSVVSPTVGDLHSATAGKTLW